MLTIITGGAMSRKDRILRDEMIKSKNNGKEILVIVPDQFSYEYDKLLYSIFGAKLFNSITVFGINRLCKEIIKNFGLKNGESADENTKMIAMYNALKSAKHEGGISYFTKNIEKPYFSKEMINVVSELRKNGISPESLEKISFESDGVLSGKIHDIGEIYGRFDRILAARGLCDGLSLTREAASIIRGNNVFVNYDIFIDRCDTFSADEYELVSALMAKCGNMFVTLTLSDENNSHSYSSPFNATVKTFSELTDIANTLSKKWERKKSRQYYYNKQALEHINANIFCIENHPASNSEGVVVVKAQDMYDEIEYCAAEIKRLVRKEGYKYRDIAVISRQLSDYIPIIEGAFERYEIPTFIDSKEPASRSVLSIYIRAVADCAKGRTFNTEKILRMIKSPLSPFKDFEIAAVEEYCYTWGVEGEMWESPFMTHDKKFLNISTVDSVREKIVEPIKRFRQQSKDQPAEVIIDNFIGLLNSFDITSCANAIAQKALSMEQEKSYVTEKSASIELVREFKQVWQMFINGLKAMRENLEGQRLSLKEFTDLFELIMSGMEVSNPPQRINTVTVASAEHSRLSAVKAVFVIGVNADKMPAAASKNGLFSEKEKRELQSNGIPMSDTALKSVQNERLVTYLALTQGSDKLYVTYPISDIKGKSLLPSSVVIELIKMFGKEVIVNASELGNDFFCQTPRSAYSKLSECLNDNTTQSETLKKALLSVDDLHDRTKNIIERSVENPFEISKSVSEKLFFRKTDDKLSILLSPSSIQKYNQCPFGYFCNYGLNLKAPIKNEMNGINRGNLLHFVLENILSTEKDGEKIYDPDFESLTHDEICAKVRKLADIYLETELGGDFGKTKRFYSSYERIIENAVYVVENIKEELSLSSFKPEAFEYSVINNDGKSMLRLENGEISVDIRGTIDRLDIYKDDSGKSYVKIVDYKTGKVKNLYKSIFHGINLQLIIYLMAILRGNSQIAGKYVCTGGIVYTPAVYLSSTATADKALETGDIQVTAGISHSYIVDKLKRFGFVVDSKEIIDAMNSDENKNFYPSSKSSVISDEKFKAIMEHTKGMILKTATDLARGKISAEPLCDATETVIKKTCAYCDYSSVCGVKNKKPKRLILNSDAERFDSILETKINAMKNELKDGDK